MEEIVYVLKLKNYPMYNVKEEMVNMFYSRISVVGKDRKQKYKSIKIMQFIPSVFIPTLTVSNHLLVLLYADNNIYFSDR